MSESKLIKEIQSLLVSYNDLQALSQSHAEGLINAENT